jgi:hypothetical protein
MTSASRLTEVVRSNGAFAGYIDAEVVSRLADVLPGARRHERAAAAVQVLAGLIFTRYILAVPAIARTSAGEAYARTLPALQAALSLEDPSPRHRSRSPR